MLSPRKNFQQAPMPEQFPMFLKISSILTALCVTQIAIVLIASPASFAASKPFPSYPTRLQHTTSQLPIAPDPDSPTQHIRGDLKSLSFQVSGAVPINFLQGFLIRRPRIADVKNTTQFIAAMFEIRWHTRLTYLIIDVRPRGILSIRLALPDSYRYSQMPESLPLATLVI
jgi:hypothetical protein